MKSAKSLIDSLVTLASLACGAFGLTRAPDLGAGFGGSLAAGLGARRVPPTGDFGTSDPSLPLPKNVATFGEFVAFCKKLATMGEPSGVDRGPKLLCLGSNGLSGISYVKLAICLFGELGLTYINTTHVGRRQGVLKSRLAANKLLESLPLVLDCTSALLRRANRSQLVRLDGGA